MNLIIIASGEWGVGSVGSGKRVQWGVGSGIFALFHVNTLRQIFCARRQLFVGDDPRRQIGPVHS